MEEYTDASKIKDPEVECQNMFDAVDSSTKKKISVVGGTMYKMNHGCRGRAIIFNHIEFKSNFSERKGAEMDVMNLREALGKLGFQKEFVDVYEDLTAAEIMDTLKKVQKDDHSDRDMLMIFVLTHGGKNDEIWAYDECYPVERLWSPFTADKCKTLAGKPKVFFVVACRGDFVDYGERLPIRRESLTEVDAKPIEIYETYSIPIWSDFLYVFSTYKGYYSFRNVVDGTWYVQAFCKELSRADMSRMSFTDFLTAVHGHLSQYESGTPQSAFKQIPTFSSTLTKQLYLGK